MDASYQDVTWSYTILSYSLRGAPSPSLSLFYTHPIYVSNVTSSELKQNTEYRDFMNFGFDIQALSTRSAAKMQWGN